MIRYSLGKKGGVEDEKYLLLLRNATWFCLDQLLISQPTEIQEESILTTYFQKMKDQGMGLKALMQDWQGKELSDWLEAKAYEKYMQLEKV